MATWLLALIQIAQQVVDTMVVWTYVDEVLVNHKIQHVEKVVVQLDLPRVNFLYVNLWRIPKLLDKLKCEYEVKITSWLVRSQSTLVHGQTKGKHRFTRLTIARAWGKVVFGGRCFDYALTNLLFGLCKPMWVIELLINRPNPISELQHALLPPKCCELGNAPQFFILSMSPLDSKLSPSRSLGCVNGYINW
jgi:hypothetical protein